MPIATDQSPPHPGGTAGTPAPREPWLVESVVAVRAPALAIAARDGQILDRDARGFSTAHGYYDHDRRILSRSELTVDGVYPEYLGHRLMGANSSRHISIVRTRSEPTPDPVITVERIHRAGQGETVVIHNSDDLPRDLAVRLRVAADLADVSDVRRGEPGDPAVLKTAAHCVRWSDGENGTTVDLEARPVPDDVAALAAEGASSESAVLLWRARVPARGSWTVTLGLVSDAASEASRRLLPPGAPVPWTAPKSTGDHRLDSLLRQGLEDLEALLLAPEQNPESVFVSAGAPWYLTLFGRDSLWTALLLLPVDDDCELAFGTLRVLAGLQGERTDPDTDEEPGKILHELRCRTTRHQEGQILPPVYYGSMDATPLFVLLLVEAYRKSGDGRRAAAFLGNARRALAWVRACAADDAALGFIRYRALNAGALFNHGWKDSADAIVGRSGRRGKGPIALSEVQAYAIAAARGFADLLEEVEGPAARPEAEELRGWAERLRQRFVERFEVREPDQEPYFAIALDGDDVPVDGLTSNIGHLLGTGMLSPATSAGLARHLMSDELFSGWGLRTRASSHPRFNKMSYHGGGVWAHDTAIAVRGLTRAAEEAAAADELHHARVCRAAARRLADGLLAAAQAFQYRLPELFSGGGRDPGDESPLPFPSACRPQAWSAAAGVAVWDALGRLAALDGTLGSS